MLSPIAVPVIRRLSTGQLARIAAVASIGLWGQMVLIYLGINHSNSAIAAIIVGLEPVLIAVWAALLLNERFVARTAAGLCIGLVGSLLVAGLGRPDGASLAGLLFLLGTGAGVLVVHGRQQVVPGHVQPGRADGGDQRRRGDLGAGADAGRDRLGNGFDGTGPRSWLMVLYLGIGNSVIAYSLWNRALRGLPAAAVGASLYAQPILGAGLSWLLLRDALPATFVPGAVLVLAGVYVASSARTRAPESLPESMP